MGCSVSDQAAGGAVLHESAGAPDSGSNRCTSLPDPFHRRYHLLGKLGKGSFAQVYLARAADGSGAELAAKTTDLRTDRGSPSPGRAADEIDHRARRVLEKEVSIMQSVREQKECVTIIDSAFEGHFSYIVMERCDMTLLHALECGPELTEETLARVVRQMLRALVGIHEGGIVHRDIKPDNFLCCGAHRDLTVKLCDFGLADVLSKQQPVLRGVYGTAPFMSPEMLCGHGYDSLTDVWSLGVVAYVLLLGHFPYQPLEANAKAMKSAIVSGLPEPSFKPKSSLPGSVYVSTAATDFLREVLCRKSCIRPSAKAALNHLWFAEATAKVEECSDASDGVRGHLPQPSFRPMLFSARRIGAFDTRNLNKDDKTSPLGGMDLEMKMLQLEFHGAKCKFVPTSRCRHPAAGVLKSGKISSDDPIRADISNVSTGTAGTGTSSTSTPTRAR